MTIHSIEQVVWSDSELGSIEIGYDTIRIFLLEPCGRRIALDCGGYIGFDGIGFWDEVVIQSASLLSQSKLIEQCIQNIEEHHGTDIRSLADSGSEERNSRRWVHLQIQLIDMFQLNVVAASIEVRVL